MVFCKGLSENDGKCEKSPRCCGPESSGPGETCPKSGTAHMEAVPLFGGPVTHRWVRMIFFWRFCSGSDFLWSAVSGRCIFCSGPLSCRAGCPLACFSPQRQFSRKWSNHSGRRYPDPFAGEIRGINRRNRPGFSAKEKPPVFQDGRIMPAEACARSGRGIPGRTGCR